jgi:hypothetical protein
MTTVRDVVQGAYARLALLPLGQNLDPDRAAQGLEAFNDMLASWAAHGLDIGFTLSKGLSDDFPLDARHVQAVKALLAVQLAANSGIEALPAVQNEARRGWNAILAQYVQAATADQDQALAFLPSQRRYGVR